MAKQVLNVGTANNDKTGDTLRAGGLKIKANFEDIYAALASDGINISGGNVLKTGNYQDLSNKPVFATVATTGDFYDLTDRPDIGIFVGAPANEMGSDGHVAGNMAFDSNFLYVCKEDYVQQDQFTGFSGVVDNAGVVVYTLNAASTSTGTTVTLVESAGSYTPQVGWEIGDGTTTRTITNVDTSGDDIVLTLDGAFTATTGVPYHIIYSVDAGQHVLIVNWDSTAYQDLFDQYTVDEKPAKLFISADGYGRVVNDVILNSTDDELYFVYTAGSAIGSFTGLTFRFNQPAIWESVAWETVFGEPGGGGAANTGDITFAGVKIIGDGIESGDGGGNGTIELVPDNDLYSISAGDEGGYGIGGQYLVIDPTTPNHIHIRAGGAQDEAPAQLILGGEKANVTVRDQNDYYDEDHHVTINTRNAENTDSYVWQFKSDGDLELPTNGGIVFDRANTTIRVGMGFHIASGEGISLDAIDETDPENLVYKNWYFGSDGNLTFPDATVQETAWAGGRVVTVPTHSTGAIGDLEGDLSFNNGYIYYCTADYGQVGHQVSVETAYNGDTSLNTNSFQLTKSADTLQIAVGDIISDHDGGATSVVASVSSDANYTYVGTGSFAYAAVFPLTFTSTDYVSGGNIWKRVAWSNDTW